MRSDLFWRISPEPFNPKKICTPLLALVFEELSAGKRIKSQPLKNIRHYEKFKKSLFLKSMLGSYIYILLKFNAKSAQAISSNWPRFVCAVYLE